MPSVAIQSSVFLPTPSGGAGAVELLVWQMADGLGKRGWTVHLFGLEDSQRPTGGTISMVPNLNHNPKEREEALVHVMRGMKPDVIFDHSLYILAGMRKDIPYVAMSHGMAPLPSWAYNVVFTSRHHGKLHHHNDPHALHLGIDLADIPETSRQREGLLWVGRILPYKRLHLACEIAKRAGAPLNVIGPITDLAYYAQVADQYAGTLQYKGELPHNGVLEWMTRAQWLLFTSDETEPAGLVMLEAMACGTPVLALPGNAAPEYLYGDPYGGRVVISVDDAVVRIKNGIWRDGHFDPRQHIAERFTIGQMVDRAEQYLIAAIEGKRW